MVLQLLLQLVKFKISKTYLKLRWFAIKIIWNIWVECYFDFSGDHCFENRKHRSRKKPWKFSYFLLKVTFYEPTENRNAIFRIPRKISNKLMRDSYIKTCSTEKCSLEMIERVETKIPKYSYIFTFWTLTFYRMVQIEKIEIPLGAEMISNWIFESKNSHNFWSRGRVIVIC